jgi:hypothetical protein
VKTTHEAFGEHVHVNVVTGVIAQALAAAARTVRASRSLLFCGLFATFVCAGVIVIWNFVFYAADIDFYGLAALMLMLVQFGTLLAFPSIFLTLPLRRLVYGRVYSAAARPVRSWTAASVAAILGLLVCIAAGIKVVQAVLPLPVWPIARAETSLVVLSLCRPRLRRPGSSRASRTCAKTAQIEAEKGCGDAPFG